MLDQLTDGGYVKTGEWMQCERNSLKAQLPHKGLMYTSMPIRNLVGKRLSDVERLSRANKNSAVYAACSRIVSWVYLCEKTGVLRNAPASEERPELTRE